MLMTSPQIEKFIFTEKSILRIQEFGGLLSLKKEVKMNKVQWKELLASFYYTEFKKLKNGHSNGYIDAQDFEIKIMLKDSTSKTVVNNFPKTAISTEIIQSLILYFEKNYQIMKSLKCDMDASFKNELIGTWYCDEFYGNANIYNYPIQSWKKKYDIDVNWNVTVTYSDIIKMKKFDAETVKRFDTGIGKLLFNTETELLEIEFENTYTIVNHRNWSNKKKLQILEWIK